MSRGNRHVLIRLEGSSDLPGVTVRQFNSASFQNASAQSFDGFPLSRIRSRWDDNEHRCLSWSQRLYRCMLGWTGMVSEHIINNKLLLPWGTPTRTWIFTCVGSHSQWRGEQRKTTDWAPPDMPLREPSSRCNRSRTRNKLYSSRNDHKNICYHFSAPASFQLPSLIMSMNSTRTTYADSCSVRPLTWFTIARRWRCYSEIYAHCARNRYRTSIMRMAPNQR
jgi:hypothetical protein